MATLSMPRLNLPQNGLAADDRRFKKITGIVLAIFIATSLVVPFLPVFEIEREKKEEIPPRFAKVLMEKKQPPAPKPKTKPKAEPEAPKKQEAKPEKKPKELPKKEKPKVAKKQSIQEKVAKVGLLALRSELESLREDPVVNRIANPKRKLIKGAKTSANTNTKPVLKDVDKGSGGIDTSKLSRRTTETEIAQRNLTQVKTAMKESSDVERKGDERRNVRTIEELRLVIERHKGSFNTLFNRQLRKTPGLQGKVLFELTIAPSGEVTNVRILESELNVSSLERKFLVKWKSIDFGAKDVDETIISYPLDFFPS